jgi:hypothetical protein
MKEPTKRQLEMLKALNPFREDINGNFKEVAKELGTSEAAIWKLMERFKERCPEVYEKFRWLRKKFNNDRRKIKNPILLDPDTLKQLEQAGKIKEVF